MRAFVTWRAECEVRAPRVLHVAVLRIVCDLGPLSGSHLFNVRLSGR